MCLCALMKGVVTLPEMPYGAADIHVCIVQALVITNYKRTRNYEYHYKFHDRQKSTYHYNQAFLGSYNVALFKIASWYLQLPFVTKCSPQQISAVQQ